VTLSGERDQGNPTIRKRAMRHGLAECENGAEAGPRWSCKAFHVSATAVAKDGESADRKDNQFAVLSDYRWRIAVNEMSCRVHAQNLANISED
jgi:hypothetical protein